MHVSFGSLITQNSPFVNGHISYCNKFNSWNHFLLVCNNLISFTRLKHTYTHTDVHTKDVIWYINLLNDPTNVHFENGLLNVQAVNWMWYGTN